MDVMASDARDESLQEPVHQACAIPFRRTPAAGQFCVITSSRGRWLFPKGFIERGKEPADTALREAYEEAGLHGRILGSALGCYRVRKNGGHVSMVALLMEVTQSDRKWPEDSLRKRRWVSLVEAGELLDDPNLLSMLLAAVARLTNGELTTPSLSSAGV
jgi:8-oxo-dGTP pyrophosphatase MutT (NUDIX family)